MIGLSMGLAVVSALAGYWMSYLFDVSIAGSMATMTGVVFLLVFLLAPERGLLAIARRRARQRWEFAQTMLAIHLLNHEDSPEAAEECREAHLHAHLRWEPDFARRVVRRAENDGWIARADEDRLALTPTGRTGAREAVGMGV
jgi:manganese/zinc/iron transport system permease protein